MEVSKEVHLRMLAGFIRAASAEDREALTQMLAQDVVMTVDTGPDGGTYGRVRNLSGPLCGARKVAAFLASVTPQGKEGLAIRMCELNGQPAALILRQGVPYTAVFLSIVDERIEGIFMQADSKRLARLGVSRGDNVGCGKVADDIVTTMGNAVSGRTRDRV